MQFLINGPLLSSKRTTHIKAKFFLTKDNIEVGDVELEYCPTKLMWIHMHTKPNQGTPFRLNRSMLMNILVKQDEKYGWKNTNPLLLPKTEEPYFIPYIDLYIGARYSIMKRPLDHRRSVLEDNTNFGDSSIRALKTTNWAKSFIKPTRPELSSGTAKRKKVLTWADVARGNFLPTTATSI